MKRSLATLFGIALVSASVGAVSAFGQGTIVGSKHDFSSGNTNRGSYGGNSNQTCVFCHTPHAATSNTVPLWNRAFTTSSFTMYSSSTLNGTITTQPGQTSIACLSCHDGTIAVSAWGGNTGTDVVTGSTNLGTNLGNDHPVGLNTSNYPTADPDITAPSTWNLPLFGTVASPSAQTQLECATCHEPHNRGAVANDFLRVTMSQSALCVRCHTK
jgi:predicted CXXCH cytochrome family protein